jgi:glycosyltransferase involved in cell wall biosynthesis
MKSIAKWQPMGDELVIRVALVGQYPLDPNQIRVGPQAVFKYLLEGLKRIDSLEIHVVSAYKSLTQVRHFRHDGVNFHFLSHPQLPMELAFLFLRRRIHRALHQINPDIVHAQSGRIHGAICLSSGYPVVATVHSIPGTEPQYAENWVSRWRMTLHEGLAALYFTANVRHIICISDHIWKGLSPRVEATFYPINNPIADAFFELPMGQEVSNRLLLVANLRRIKRPDLALEAVALARCQVPELTLHLAGACHDNTVYKQLQDIMNRHNLYMSVRLLGYLCEEPLREQYQQASIVLLTSDLETSPMVVQQAMAAGKPVIATAVGGVPHLVDNGRTGLLVEPGNAMQLAKAIVRLVSDHDLRARLGQAARAEALARFHTASVAQKTYAVYEQILNSTRGTPREPYKKSFTRTQEKVPHTARG